MEFCWRLKELRGCGFIGGLCRRRGLCMGQGFIQDFVLGGGAGFLCPQKKTATLHGISFVLFKTWVLGGDLSWGVKIPVPPLYEILGVWLVLEVWLV